MRSPLFTLLAALVPAALADVKFTSPAAGGTLAAGTVQITWTDSGVAPALNLLTSYTLQLMVGGNDDSATPLVSVAGAFSAGNAASLAITPTLAGPTPNGFYIKMVSTASQGGTVTNYSNRFNIPGMTGTTTPADVAAINALGGATTGPPTQNGVTNGAGAAAGGAAGAQGTGFSVPYNLQTGLTKFAPMQPIPPTSITASSFSPLFPTSAFTIATTWVAHPSIVTTLTASQTFSVSSMENTAAAASMPSGDMQKFLARWKD